MSKPALNVGQKIKIKHAGSGMDKIVRVEKTGKRFIDADGIRFSNITWGSYGRACKWYISDIV